MKIIITWFGSTEMLESPLFLPFFYSKPRNNCRNLHNKALPQAPLAGSWLLGVRRDRHTLCI